jgi:hypothetical protein
MGLAGLTKEDLDKAIEDIKLNAGKSVNKVLPEKAKTETAKSAQGSAVSGIPFQAYKGTAPYIFISYAHKDSDTVFPIIAEFHKAGFPIWYDQGIELGNWPKEIGEAILKSSLFIVFISKSAAESPNVYREINYALSKNKRYTHIWLEDAPLDSGLEIQISAVQGIMRFKMAPEDFYRKCYQAFDSSGIKKIVH